MTPRLFRRLHEIISRRIDLADATQLAYDVDPSTLLGADGSERLRIMRDHGSARLTIGGQSMDDGTLTRMRRAHDADGIRRAVDQCRSAGFEDICVEFIYGYPDQTMAQRLQTLRSGIALGVEEIQLFRLWTIPYGVATS